MYEFAGGWICQEDCRVGMRGLRPVDLVFADPPFGIDFEKSHQMYNRNRHLVIGGYEEVKEDYAGFTREWVTLAFEGLRKGGALWAVSGWTNAHIVHKAILDAGFNLINKVIWRYNFGVYTKKKFVTSHYEMFYAVKPPASKRTFNRLLENTKEDYHDRQDVWEIKREYHPNRMKNITKLPDALVAKAIRHTTNTDGTVLDPFLGNGTTLFVGLDLGRKVYGFETNPAAFKMMKRRLECTST